MNKQSNLQTLFSAKKTEKKVERVKTVPGLTHEDPRVQAFYDQLTPQQIVAHTIAITHLGTSYDVMRTHGFTAYLKSLPQ